MSDHGQAPWQQAFAQWIIWPVFLTLCAPLSWNRLHFMFYSTKYTSIAHYRL